MKTSLVLTVIGPDRPGLVSALSDAANRFGANWEESLMANLAGQFAGIVHIQVPAANCDALIGALRALEASGMHIGIARGKDSGVATASRRLKLELVGHDRPGIIRSISNQLAELGISIESLQTQVESGAWSGDRLFRMTALLQIPQALDTDVLRKGLEGLANELMVDIALDDAGKNA
jgi:glycine cleavage system regulatory protein